MSAIESAVENPRVDSEDDDEPQLSCYALAALNEFLAEKNEKEEKLRHLAEAEDKDHLLNEIDLDEDWQLSQFWYEDSTTEVLARESLKLAGENGSIACISCPTLYKHLRKVKPSSCTVKLLEFDSRFSCYGSDFVPYDYNAPLEVPKDLQSSFTVVVADPPFLSEECLTKTALTMRFLTKGSLILCTGAVMSELASRLLQLKMCEFRPRHKNNLANDFRCYANFDFES
nr:EOG090X0ABW [Sida crystallina]